MQRVLASGSYILGPEVRALEEDGVIQQDPFTGLYVLVQTTILGRDQTGFARSR